MQNNSYHSAISAYYEKVEDAPVDQNEYVWW